MSTRDSEKPPPTLADAIGGPLGMAESALPAVAYVAAYTVTGQDTTLSAMIALALALALTLGRLARRQSPQQAISGLVGVGFAAFVAAKSGKAENFFLPGLIANAAYASAFVVSNVIRRPIVGFAVAQLEGIRDGAWRTDPRMPTFRAATWGWAGLFGLRLAVQLPLYLAHAVVALGVARTILGLPLFGLGLWLSYLLVRRAGAPASPGPEAVRPSP